ncbi:hypothetical protein GP486_004470 [Trichoglossum hirsutum]|uniref:Uncharacterized protein n=1 Tax=Trichoglossum hirsutum TaxID=265104 RepID=A0A9P8LB00_9PEZI|nr:hypothetical protein GP486_004470 [Trichoglossum hirsutum]
MHCAFWVSASSPEKLSQGYVDIARELGFDNGLPSADQSKSVDLVKKWFMSTGEHHYPSFSDFKLTVFR